MNAQPIDTETLRRLADAAPPGPWEAARDTAWGEEYPSLSIQPVQESWDSDPAHACCEPLEESAAEFIAAARTAVPALLDALAAAEHRIARLEAQTDVRGRAVVIYRERAREAEAQIKAVRELHCSDGHDGTCGGSDCFESCVGCLEDYPCSTIRVLEGEAAWPPSTSPS